MKSPISDSDFICAFLPSAERAQLLDARMRSRLADSVRRVAEQARGHIPIPGESLARFLARAESGGIPPLVFGAYYDLVLALESGALARAGDLLGEIAESSPAAKELDIVALGANSRQESTRRYQRLFNTDESTPLEINPPDPDIASAYRARVIEALGLLDRGYPELAAEIRILVREVVLAAGPSDPNAAQFGGVSSFMLWGALALNVSFPLSRVEMVEALAHESAHNLLFGLSSDGPLLENDASLQHPSPLRRDLRHLDGIYHATFVSARMHRAVSELLTSDAFEPGDEDEARKALVTNRQNFSAGLETLLAHAKLTRVGRKVLDGARVYLQQPPRETDDGASPIVSA
jgi:hypothetical protein